MTVEQAALWKCFYAGLYDTLTQPNRYRPTDKEWAAMSEADRVKLPRNIFDLLKKKGLVDWRKGGGVRLTEAGRKALRS